ncbi:MAG: hypothetical protein ISR90_01680 [Candidatus Marinimicrobia bacterium]|nr:hypothetical protein [Candidatus Neomarinimicrobiota bacterium]MBL7022755.1 hypothetical protein [Candidatus Neomarinimicrobiota bacterium]MBL7109607.1 hypothetical protein [Candidatus Neomarinimicrobiota bacterium]
MNDKNKEIITRFAGRIVDRGMATPSVFYLEMVKYVSFLGSQLMVFFGPIITAFVKSDGYYNIAELLEDKKNVEFLLTEIERLAKFEKSTQKLEEK